MFQLWRGHSCPRTPATPNRIHPHSIVILSEAKNLLSVASTKIANYCSGKLTTWGIGTRIRSLHFLT